MRLRKRQAFVENRSYPLSIVTKIAQRQSKLCYLSLTVNVWIYDIQNQLHKLRILMWISKFWDKLNFVRFWFPRMFSQVFTAKQVSTWASENDAKVHLLTYFCKKRTWSSCFSTWADWTSEVVQHIHELDLTKQPAETNSYPSAVTVWSLQTYFRSYFQDFWLENPLGALKGVTTVCLLCTSFLACKLKFPLICIQHTSFW